MVIIYERARYLELLKKVVGHVRQSYASLILCLKTYAWNSCRVLYLFHQKKIQVFCNYLMSTNINQNIIPFETQKN